MKLITWMLLAMMLSAPTSAIAQPQSGVTRGSSLDEQGLASLTPAEKQTIASLRKEAAARAVPLCLKLMTKQNEMESLWAADNPDRVAILNKDIEIATIQSELQQLHTEFGFRVHEMLTPRQWSEWVQSEPGFGMGAAASGTQPGGPSDAR